MTIHPYNLLTDYFLEEYHIDVSVPREVEIVAARSLVCANRFDLMAKWIYIDAKEKNMDMKWPTDVYRDNINAFSCGTFTEPGSPQKNTFEKYKEDFDRLIEEIKYDGFDMTKSAIPVGECGVIFDGSHRVAIAAYYNKQIGIVKFADVKPYNTYDYQYFRKYLMSDIYMGYMAIKFAELREHSYFVCIWPAADVSIIDQAEEILRNNGSIIYDREIYLTYNGMRNLMIQTYGCHNWTGSSEDNYSGIDAKARLCYRKGYPIHTYLLEVESIERVLSVKSAIRDLFKIENHSIHISDDIDETKDLTELLYNPNSVHFLNFAAPFKYAMVYRQVNELKTRALDRNLDISRFIVDSSGVLEACGVRAAKDFDYLTDYPENKITDLFCGWNAGLGEAPSNHIDQLQYHAITVADMLYNPENYFYYNGMKFLSLERLSEMKKNRREKKDIVDAKLCMEFLFKEREIPIEYRKSSYEKAHKYQVAVKDYGNGPLAYRDYRNDRLMRAGRQYIGEPVKRILRRIVTSILKQIAAQMRWWWLHIQKTRLRNRDMSIISSNCNGGVFLSDMEIAFRSPFVNLFIRASDYVRMLTDLQGYLNEELHFVKETDEIYGDITYPTAYLRDVKIYFMHYDSEEDARDAWNRRTLRINWDDLFIMFTDRSGCTQKDLVDFDNLPYRNKVVFTHVPHPEIKSAVYIRGYENEEKVGVLSDFENNEYRVKRIYDQFDMVGWLNKNGDL